MFVMKHKLMEGEDEGKGGSSGGVDEATVKARVDAAVAEATKSLNGKNQELLNEVKTFKEKNKELEGLDLEKLKNLQKHMNESEEAKLIAEGKFDEVFDRRFSRVREDYDTKLGAANTKIEESDSKAVKFEKLYSQERIRNRAIRSAEKAGVLPDAIDDVVDKVMSRFKLDEKGGLEARDESGSLVMSKDGKTVLQPEEYISETVKSKYPYYWPSSRSGGLGGAGGGGGPSGMGGVDEQRTVDAAKTKNMSEFRALRKKQRSGT